MNPTVVTLVLLAFAIVMFILEKIPLGLTATDRKSTRLNSSHE